MSERLRITFLGNFAVPYTSESHHAASLESLGHTVVRLQEAQAGADEIADEAKASDLFCWVHTHGWHTPNIERVLTMLRHTGIPSVTYHLDLWLGLHRERDMRAEPYWEIDHFFTVDRRMAQWLNENTAVRGHYLTAGVYHDECWMADRVELPAYDVTFIGSRDYHPEWPYRRELVRWLHRTYTYRFRHFGPDGYGLVRGMDLNHVFAEAKVVVGDSLCLGFDYPDYWSDRVYETLGRGGFLIHPYIPGMERQFTNGEHLVFYPFGEFDELHKLIDYYKIHDDEREAIRLAGHNHVAANHTYRHRWQTILETLS